jgi:WD40 repeat protein
MILLAFAQILDVAAHGDRVAVAHPSGVTLGGRPVKTAVRQIAGVALSPDGELCVFGGRPGEAGEAEIPGRWIVSDHKDMVNAVAFGADWMATGSQDRTIAIRGLDGKVRRWLSGHTAGVLALAAGGGWLASAGLDRTIRLWNPATGELARAISNHHDRVGALAFSPDGKLLASGSRDRTVRIWQPETGRLVRIVRDHEGEVLDLAWGRVLVSGCEDGKVRVIDAAEGSVVDSFDSGGFVWAVAILREEILCAADEIRRWRR